MWVDGWLDGWMAGWMDGWWKCRGFVCVCVFVFCSTGEKVLGNNAKPHKQRETVTNVDLLIVK